MIMRILFIFLNLLVFSHNALSQGVGRDSSELRQRRLMSLVDYIRGDYGQAVQRGEVLSDMEYAEMQEFASAVLDLGTEEVGDEKKIVDLFRELQTLIEKKSSVDSVQELASNIRTQLLQRLPLDRGPSQHPQIAKGAEVYQQLCASCHGQDGHGNGPLSKGMEPAPRNFHDAEAMETASPLKFFNIQKTGLEGTSMVSYQGVLSDEQMWDVAFYLIGLRYTSEAVVTNKQWMELRKSGLNLEILASQTDGDLREWLKNDTVRETPVSLAQLRSYVLPELKGRKKIILYLGQLELSLQEAVLLAEQSLFADINIHLTDNYLEYFEPLEAFLKVEDPDKTQNIEQAFMTARAFAARKSSQVSEPLKQAIEMVQSLKSQVVQSGASRPKQEFASGFLIILREGFEAFLVVAALLAMAKNLGSNRARWMVHGGWIAAILSGAAVWYGMEFIWAVSGAQRELIEAVFTALAVLMLLYTGFWLLSQGDHKNWGQYVKIESKNAAETGQYWGVAVLSFVAVFREAAETILFYQALLHKAETPVWMLSGFVLGLGCLCVLAWVILRLNMRLPLHLFFRVTSALMVVLAVVLAGQSVYEFMAAGYLTPTPLPMVPTMTAFGIYPSLETIGVQVCLMVLGFAGTYCILRQKKLQVSEVIT